MTLRQPHREVAVQLLIEKSHRNLQQAIANANLGYWDLVANRLYYSIFHAVTALMMEDGITVHTHKGTSSQFGKYYIQTKKFEREDGILFSRLQTMREIADYQNIFCISEEEGIKLIEITKNLHSRIISAINT